MINSAGDVGTWVHTNLATNADARRRTPAGATASPPTWRGPNPQYIATIGVVELEHNTAFGFWSGDGGSTWASFATLPPGAATNTSHEASIAVTARNKAVWAPANSVPSYTTDNGATWTPTNLPTLPRLAASTAPTTWPRIA